MFEIRKNVTTSVATLCLVVTVVSGITDKAVIYGKSGGVGGVGGGHCTKTTSCWQRKGFNCCPKIGEFLKFETLKSEAVKNLFCIDTDRTTK